MRLLRFSKTAVQRDPSAPPEASRARSVDRPQRRNGHYVSAFCSVHHAPNSSRRPVRGMRRRIRGASFSEPLPKEIDDRICGSGEHYGAVLPPQGFACSSCVASYFRDAENLCQPCNNYVWVLYLVGIVVAIALAPLLMKIARSQGFMSVNIFVGTMQVRAICIIIKK